MPFVSNEKRRIELAATTQSAALIPLCGLCPNARATWGDVCSLARRISSFGNDKACMKPAFCRGVLCRPLLSCSRRYRASLVT